MNHTGDTNYMSRPFSFQEAEDAHVRLEKMGYEVLRRWDSDRHQWIVEYKEPGDIRGSVVRSVDGMPSLPAELHRG